MPPEAPAVETVIVPRTSDLGDGFTVRRALPSAQRRLVGPFVFFDQMGPAVIAAGHGLDVRPHPHIGLATVTFVFDGEIMHRDSLGTVQRIRPGEVNWMTAGRGIVHSERTPPELRARGTTLSGIQTWVALPAAREETAPAFAHHAADALPVLDAGGATLRLVVGSLHGARSPVETLSPMFFADLQLAPGARFELLAEHEERAAYVFAGAVLVEGEDPVYESGRLVVFRSGETVVLRACAPATRIVLLGGAAMDGPRYVWWNFVSRSIARIEQAQADWREGRFVPVPGETEFVPLPGNRPLPVPYP